MKKNLFFLLFLLPAFYADALNVCVDFISQSQDSLKYELRVKRTLNFVKYNDFIKVEKFGNESIQVYKFEKEAFPPINNKYYAEVFFLKNTKIYIDMYSEYKDDMRTPLKLDCVMVKLNVNENNTANIFFDKETTIEIRKN